MAPPLLFERGGPTAGGRYRVSLSNPARRNIIRPQEEENVYLFSRNRLFASER
jgi:hypothetical protein